VGIEPNPGPSTMMVVRNPMGRKEASVAKYAGLGQQRKQKKPGKKLKQLTPQARRSGGQISSQAQDYDMYHCVLNNPFDCLPVRLGGEMMQPSGIATLSWRGQISTSAAGNLSLVYYPWGINPLLVSTSAASPYGYTVQAGPYPGSGALVSLAPNGRVIASALRIVTTASATNNQGIVTIGCLPRSNVQAAGTTAVTTDGFPITTTLAATQGFNEFFNYLETESFPLKDGSSAFYRPQDPLDYTFRDVTIGGNGVLELGEDLQPFIVVGITGAAASSIQLVEVITHIEYTVTTGTTGVVNTGQGRMSQQGLIDSARSVFGDALNSVVAGVTGGLRGVAAYGVGRLVGALTDGNGSAYSNSNNVGRRLR